MSLKWSHFIFRKNHPRSLLDRFNAAVISTQKLTDRIWSTYYGDIAEERRRNNCRELGSVLSPLKLSDSIGFFVILFFGVIASVLTFCAEIFVHKKVPIQSFTHVFFPEYVPVQPISIRIKEAPF